MFECLFYWESNEFFGQIYQKHTAVFGEKDIIWLKTTNDFSYKKCYDIPKEHMKRDLGRLHHENFI
jgi:hypothetical protein